jgi:hypothetical protein
LYNVPRIAESFRNGGGIPYSEIGPDVPCAIEQVFRPGYLHFLVAEWLAKVPGLIERLRNRRKCLDVGCGRGQSTVAMARAFPNSRFVGIDYHADSASPAPANSPAVTISAMSSSSPPRRTGPRTGQLRSDLRLRLHPRHGPPRGRARTIRARARPDGVFVWGEPNATHEPVQNRNPIGRLFHAISPLHCLTVSLAHGGAGLGTVIGEAGARKLAQQAGFATFEKLPTNHPFNQFFACRPN